MSVYFNKNKQLYVVRSYRKGSYAYIGQYPTIEEAQVAEDKWRADLLKEKQEDSFAHTIDWFQEKSKQQIRDFPLLYRGFKNGRAI